MSKISASEARPGDAVVYENTLFMVLNYEHHKPGKGGAVVRLKLRNVKTNSIKDETLRPTDNMDLVELELKEMQYLYKEGELFVFMDNENYEQSHLAGGVLGDAVNYLRENDTITVEYHGTDPIGIKLPSAVVLAVKKTDPATKGNTVNNATKEALLETGFAIQVPMFVNEGDKVKVDTRTGRYLERA